MRSYRDEMNRFTCSSFLSRLGDQPKHMLVAGQESGSCAFINMWTTDVMFELDAHTSSIDAVWTSMNQRLVLTNGADGEMKLWDATRPMIGGSATSKPTGLKLHSTYEECFNPQFSHDSRSIVSSHVVHEASNLPASIQIGQRYRTTVHDVETKKTAQILEDVNGTTMYSSGSCCFDPLDRQVFCDGQLWDLRSNSVIHRFDRLGNEGNAVFHPRRSELIVDSAIWDLRMLGSDGGGSGGGTTTTTTSSRSGRTSRLLKVVPALDDSVCTFSACGDALYTYKIANGDLRGRTNQVVRVLDGWDQDDIGQPIELEDNDARSLCTDLHDDYIAITVDGQVRSESCVKLYEVGRRKPNEADSDMDDAQSESEAADDDEEDDEFGFDDAEDDMYYDIDGSGGGLLDVEPDLEDFLFG